MSGPEPARPLALRGIGKRYGATQALSGVDLEVEEGEVHALLGGNGSGKSTIIKILAGVVRADAGEIEVAGEIHSVDDYRSRHANDGGIRCVHQQGMTFAGISVAENLVATGQFPTTRWGAVSWGELRRRAAAILERYGIDADPRDPIGQLRPVTQQMIAIARALHSDTGEPVRTLVLDEPTATLPRAEVDILHEAVRRYVDLGCSVIYVTHRLEELYGFADRATVLRDGEVVARLARDEIAHDRLVELLTGDRTPDVVVPPVSLAVDEPHAPRGGVRVVGLQGGPVEGIDLTVSRGEIVGVAGLVGSGRSSVLKMVFGLHRPSAGTIEIDSVVQRHRRGVPFEGVAYIPQDRLAEASFSTLSVRENLLAADTGRHWKAARIRAKSEARDARGLLQEFRVKAGSDSALYSSLSGGNQQKVILARWMSCRPKVILLDEPSQGVDLGARTEIHSLVRRAADDGAAVIVVSSDLEELAALCDRAVVLARGRITAHVPRDEMTAQNLERLSYGIAE